MQLFEMTGCFDFEENGSMIFRLCNTCKKWENKDFSIQIENKIHTFRPPFAKSMCSDLNAIRAYRIQSDGQVGLGESKTNKHGATFTEILGVV